MSHLADVVDELAVRIAQRRLDGVAEALNAAELAGADADRCAGLRWEVWMLLGAWERAWCETDAIRARGAQDVHRLWQGEDVCGKRLMVRSLHGLGDAVQAMRFMPRLHAMAAQLTLQVPPALMHTAPYFEGMQGVQVTTWGDGLPADEPRWDVQIEITELAYLLRAQPEDASAPGAYLKLPGTLVEGTRDAMGSASRPRVGLVWSCGRWNTSRDVPESQIRTLLAVDDRIEFWNLQSADRARPAWGVTMHDASVLVGDGVLRLAATVANLQLVITADTLVAHLAGAMGKPVWLMLQHAADWRWGLDASTSRWYPTMRIFRQRVEDDWAGVLADVQQRLRELVV